MNVYDYGARNYDPAIGRFFNIDRRAEQYFNQTNYALSVNNPVFFVDINGEGVDTDYKVITTNDEKGKIVRADPNDGSDKNKTDRILKTDRKGNVDYKNPKVDNIAKGIITEGMNMRTDNQIIEVDGIGQPKTSDVVSFLEQFAENVAEVEISGFEGVGMNNAQNLIMTEPYKDNKYAENKSLVLGLNAFKTTTQGSIFIKAHFHTHPSRTGGHKVDINEPSPSDKDGRDARNLIGGAPLPHFIYNINGRKPYKP